MKFIPNTILGFFDSSQKSYEIPVYQRAYSWEKENWKTFLDDLREHLEGNNNYFFGNLLLEVIFKNKKYEIIDGQQRVTTLAIFIRAILNILETRKDEPVLSGFDYKEKVDIFLKNGGNIKLRPVEYDRACYDALIVDNKSKFEIGALSQKRIKEAKEYFEKELNSLNTQIILAILNKIENTELTVIELEGKKDSALMFELENNRGKDLTNMERIKSYFMYQMYVYSKPEEIETNIENISNIFKLIYLIINDLKKLNEDSILIYHNNAYIKGFSYRTLEDVKDEFKKSSEDKVNWIKNYINELYTTFYNLKKFEGSSSYFAQKLFELGIPAYVYPFIIRGYKYIGDDSSKLDALFHILEILTFRTKLINSRANIQERLNAILLSFEGNISELLETIKIKLNESWYWGDDNTKNYLNGGMYGNNVLNYLLWRYEDSIQSKKYVIAKISIEDEQIEHISPRKPPDGEPIETGYDIDKDNQYSEEFISRRLNCLGNLMLISGSHNALIGNKPFKNKLSSYKKIVLLKQQVEIEDFSKIEYGEPVWKEVSIIERHKKILDFAIQTWSF